MNAATSLNETKFNDLVFITTVLCGLIEYTMESNLIMYENIDYKIILSMFLSYSIIFFFFILHRIIHFLVKKDIATIIEAIKDAIVYLKASFILLYLNVFILINNMIFKSEFFLLELASIYFLIYTLEIEKAEE